MLNISLDCNSS